MTAQIDDIAIEIQRLLAARTPASSICPSDVARSLHAEEKDWRALMPVVREVARQMAADGRVVITQRGAILDPETSFKGPIRLQRGPNFAVSR